MNLGNGIQDHEQSEKVYPRAEVEKLLEGLFKYLQASDDSAKTPQEKLEFYLNDHDLTQKNRSNRGEP